MHAHDPVGRTVHERRAASEREDADGRRAELRRVRPDRALPGLGGYHGKRGDL